MSKPDAALAAEIRAAEAIAAEARPLEEIASKLVAARHELIASKTSRLNAVKAKIGEAIAGWDGTGAAPSIKGREADELARSAADDLRIAAIDERLSGLQRAQEEVAARYGEARKRVNTARAMALATADEETLQKVRSLYDEIAVLEGVHDVAWRAIFAADLQVGSTHAKLVDESTTAWKNGRADLIRGEVDRRSADLLAKIPQ